MRLAAALAAAALAMVAANAPRADASPPTLGFAENAFQFFGEASIPDDRIAGTAAHAGARLLKFRVPWRGVQQHRGGPMKWDRYDSMIEAMRRRRIRPVLVLHDTPEWASGLYCSARLCPPGEAYMEDWAGFARAVARRYGNAAAIVIWNEPNLRGQWRSLGGPNPRAYANVYTAAAKAIHSVRPRMPVLVGSLAPFWGQERLTGHLSISTFLAGFYSAIDRNVLRPDDGIALHAHSGPADVRKLRGHFAKTIGETRAARDRLAPGTKIWITEAGLTTKGPQAVKPRAQAKAIETLLNGVRKDEDLGAVIVHSLFDRPGHQDPHERGWGMLEGPPSLKPKPAYCRLVSRAAGPLEEAGCAGHKQLAFGKLKLKRKTGTARLIVKVPGPGTVALIRRSRIKGFVVERGSAGKARMMIRPRGAAKRQLRRFGRRSKATARALIKVKWVPDYGKPTRISKPVKLVRRR